MFINPEQIKKDNTEFLNNMGLPLMDSLGLLEITQLRTSNEVANRTIVLATFIQLLFGAPNDFVDSYFTEHNLLETLTDDEKRRLLIDYEDWTDKEKNDLEHSIEIIWILVWAGGLNSKELTFNTPVDETLAAMLPQFFDNEPPTDFINNFNLLPDLKIFTELDKFYRVHESAKNISSTKVSLSLVKTRYKILKWINDNSINWDGVSS
ncbi:MAG: DUF4272 domain-containing protein [Saccharospirillaceae bacterium]|nr:DUF4272 domain-containing protein [Pseudomonadales bacterium]NRB77545.1 DUF4272 domain-containing protein [Saccharospirillaceae bacterium]